MKSKSIIIILVVIAVALGAYLLFRQTPDSAKTDQLNNNEGGAEGSGLSPEVSKFCEDNNLTPKEKISGTKLTIAQDKKSILLNDKAALFIADLPTTIDIDANSSFGVTNKEFTSAILSPQKSLIAFTVSSGTHGWAGIKNVFSGMTYPVAFQFEGIVENPKWNAQGTRVSFSKITPKPAAIVTVADTIYKNSRTSDYEKIIDFVKINPLPAGITADLNDHYWTENNEIALSVFLKDSKSDTEHSELWTVNPANMKWGFVCTLK